MSSQTFLDLEIDAQHRRDEAMRSAAHRGALAEARRAHRARQAIATETAQVSTPGDTRTPRRQSARLWFRVWPFARLGRPTA